MQNTCIEFLLTRFLQFIFLPALLKSLICHLKMQTVKMLSLHFDQPFLLFSSSLSGISSFLQCPRSIFNYGRHYGSPPSTGVRLHALIKMTCHRPADKTALPGLDSDFNDSRQQVALKKDANLAKQKNLKSLL